MLTELRKNAKSILWPVTIIMILGMAGWGAWEGVRSLRGREETRIASFRGRNITLDELREAYLASQIFSQILGIDANPEALEQRAWEIIILEDEAERWGIETTRAELASFIRNIPIFRDQNRFDPNLYRLILRNWQLSENFFEEQMRRLVTIEKLQGVIMNTAHASPTEVEEYYLRVSEEVRVDYVLFNRDDFLQEVSLEEDQIRDFYNRNTQRYSIPDRARIEYILIGRDDLPDEKRVSEEEIDRYLEERSLSGELTREDARQSLELRRLEELAAEIDRLLATEDSLEAVAEEYSLVLHRPEPFARGEEIEHLGTVEEINRLAFEWPEGDISHPILLEEGICFFQIREKQSARVLALSEARERVEQDARREMADSAAFGAAREKLARVQSLMNERGVGLGEAAEEIGLEVRSSPAFSQMDASLIAEEVGSNEFAGAAFFTPEGQLSRVFRTFDGHGILQVVERIEPEPIPEEEFALWKDQAVNFKRQLVFEDWSSRLFSDLRIRGGRREEPRPAAESF